MTIDGLSHLIDGGLTNTPSVHSVEGATVFPSKVEQGDVFFSSDPDEIATAIERGAFAIVYDEESIKQTDSEIAWIKVASIETAAAKLLGYVCLQKDAKLYRISPLEHSFLKMLLLQKSGIVFLAQEWRRSFEQIMNAPQKLFVGSDSAWLAAISPEHERLEHAAEGSMVADTLFRGTFKIGRFLYQEKELAPFHLDTLLRVVHFCQTQQLSYSIDRLKYTKHFYPVFIDGKLRTARSSSSDKVVVFTDNLPDIESAREYLKYHGTWVKSIVLTPPKTKVESVDRPIWYEHEEAVRDTLKNTHFNYAFVYALDRTILKTIQREYGLFG
jgi:hypothetical protein